MNIAGHDIGVCSWSLRPRDFTDLIEKTRELNVQHIQLALGPLLGLDDKRKYHELGSIKNSGLHLTAGMIGFPGEDYSSIPKIRETGGLVPESTWPLRKRIVEHAAALAHEMGIRRLSTHAGFLPSPGQHHYGSVLARFKELASVFTRVGVELLFETGQEKAGDLAQFLDDLESPIVGANFDPANMILYGAGDPIEAVGILGSRIRHVHIKDAIASANPGMEWGKEVPFGTGDVGAERFMLSLKTTGYTGPLVIEREAGTDCMKDVRTAIEAIRSAVGK